MCIRDSVKWLWAVSAEDWSRGVASMAMPCIKVRWERLTLIKSWGDFLSCIQALEALRVGGQDLVRKLVPNAASAPLPADYDDDGDFGCF
eukprot:1331818-Prorocentrum_lima.AAC.1